jgi:hypothetical protein
MYCGYIRAPCYFSHPFATTLQALGPPVKGYSSAASCLSVFMRLPETLVIAAAADDVRMTV